MGIYKGEMTEWQNWEGHFVYRETQAPLNGSDVPKVTYSTTRPPEYWSTAHSIRSVTMDTTVKYTLGIL